MGKSVPIEHPEQGGEVEEGEDGGGNGEQDRHQTNHLQRILVRVEISKSLTIPTNKQPSDNQKCTITM